MKKIILLLYAFTYGIFACAQPVKEGFLVSGNIHELTDPYIYLRWADIDSAYYDSAMVNNGKFTFTGKLKEPAMAVIYLKKSSGYFQFFLENTMIRIEGEFKAMNHLKSTGSVLQDEYQNYKNFLKDIPDRFAFLSKAYQESAKRQDSSAATLLKQIHDLQKQKEEKNIVYIQQHRESVVSLHLLNGLRYSSTSSDTLKKLFDELAPSLQQSLTGKKLSGQLRGIEKVSEGKQAPEFVLEDQDGKPVSLSMLRGKYVLIDFWASWCGPCRAEHPNIVSVYHKFKDKGFTILGISLDNKKDKWQEAIKKDDLVWTQVSDLKGWESSLIKLYGVNAIPANFLIDPQGIIIMRNLRGKDLEKKLSELL